jgi:ABC-type dipeptide/oligopeptide/nickel transport system permease component
LQPPGEGFRLGTDMLGRDVLAGIFHGARVSLFIGVVATVFAVAIGVVVGAVAGYYGGIVDDVADARDRGFQTIPSFVLAVLLVAIFTPTLASIDGGHRRSSPGRAVAASPGRSSWRCATASSSQAGRAVGRARLGASSSARSCRTRCRRSSSWPR